MDARVDRVQLLGKRVVANLHRPLGALWHSKPPPATIARLPSGPRSAVVRHSCSPSAAPAQRGHRRRIGTTARSQRCGTVKPLRSPFPRKSYAHHPVHTRSCRHQSSWLPGTPSLGSFRSWFVLSGPDSAAGNPRKGKTLKCPPIGGFAEFSRRAPNTTVRALHAR